MLDYIDHEPDIEFNQALNQAFDEVFFEDLLTVMALKWAGLDISRCDFTYENLLRKVALRIRRRADEFFRHEQQDDGGRFAMRLAHWGATVLSNQAAGDGSESLGALNALGYALRDVDRGAYHPALTPAPGPCVKHRAEHLMFKRNCLLAVQELRVAGEKPKDAYKIVEERVKEAAQILGIRMGRHTLRNWRDRQRRQWQNGCPSRSEWCIRRMCAVKRGLNPKQIAGELLREIEPEKFMHLRHPMDRNSE